MFIIVIIRVLLALISNLFTFVIFFSRKNRDSCVRTLLGNIALSDIIYIFAFILPLMLIIKVVHRLKTQLNEFLEPQAQALGSVGLGSGSTVSSLGSCLDSGSVYWAWIACSKISPEYSVILYLLPFSMLKVTFGHFEQFLETAIRL
jgi:hypothetical protein